MNEFEQSTDDSKGQTTSLDDVLAAYAELEAVGETIDQEAFIAQYPNRATELREFFYGKELLDVLVKPATESSSESNRLTEAFAGGYLGRFELRREHARGGLGKVWRAHDPVLRREIALKEIREEQAQNPIVRHRFLREAQITGQLEHPNIVPVHELGRDGRDDRLFYTMRFVQGETLREVIEEHHRKYGRRAPESSRRLLNKFVNICEAMAYAHARGVVHRDLKPQNVAIGEFGEVVVMDWGLAKIGEKDDDSARTVGLSSDAKGQQTMAGHAMGTPAYMAPEQAAGKTPEINSRTDVYGLGAILFELLTGSAPHRGPTTDAILKAILDRDTPSARERLATVPKPLDAICAKAMAKLPGDRYSSANQLAHDIQHWLDDEPISVCRETWFRRAGRWQRRHRPLVALALMFALLVGSCVGWFSMAARQQSRDRLMAWNKEVETQRDEARVHLIFGDAESVLKVCDEALATHGFRYAPRHLKRLADGPDAELGEVADDFLSALTELAMLRVRGKPQHAIDVDNPTSQKAADAQALLLADAWSTPLDHFLAGEASQYAGDFREAIDSYEATLALEPDHCWAHTLTAICRFELGEPLRALESFNQAVRQKPQHKWLYASRALVFADLGLWKEANDDLDKAEQLDPEFYGTFNNRGVVWYTRAMADKTATTGERRAWLKDAIKQYEKAVERNDKFENAYNNYGLAAQELARLLQAEGEKEDAETWLKDAKRKFAAAMTTGSNRVTAFVNSAILRAEFADLEEVKFDDARFDLTQADDEAKKLQGAEHRPATRLIAYGRAFVEGLTAERLINTAEEPADVTAASNAVQKAIEQFRKVVPEPLVDTDQQSLPVNEKQPSTVNDHLARDARLARARLRFQLFQKALPHAEDIVDDSFLLLLIGDLDVLAKLNPRRLTDAERGDVFAMRANVRSFLERNGDTLVGDVLADYGRALEATPNDPSLHLRRGWILAMSQPRALREFNLAISGENALKEPALLADAYNGRGYVLALEGQDVRAVDDAKRAADFAPSDWNVQFNAAVTYALSADIAAREHDNTELATEYTRQAVDLLKKALANLQTGESEWKEKWLELLEQERGLIAIREHDGFKALLH